ncbi:MAG: hypothetical protein WAR83_14850, partial [Flavobacteriales bacterium]
RAGCSERPIHSPPIQISVHPFMLGYLRSYPSDLMNICLRWRSAFIMPIRVISVPLFILPLIHDPQTLSTFLLPARWSG